VQLRESLREYDSIITGMPKRQFRIPAPLHPGLTEQEVLVLEMVNRTEGMSPAELVKQTGLTPSDINVVLERLVQLHYLSRKGARYEAEGRRPST
jgi:DNA-binding MarR family transcriptional regulator